MNMDRALKTLLVFLLLASLGLNLRLSWRLAELNWDLTRRQGATLRYAAICLDAAAGRLDEAARAKTAADREAWLERSRELFHAYSYLNTLARRQVPAELSMLLYQLERALVGTFEEVATGPGDRLPLAALAARTQGEVLRVISEVVEEEGHLLSPALSQDLISRTRQILQEAGVWEPLREHFPSDNP